MNYLCLYEEESTLINFLPICASDIFKIEEIYVLNCQFVYILTMLYPYIYEYCIYHVKKGGKLYGSCDTIFAFYYLL